MTGPARQLRAQPAFARTPLLRVSRPTPSRRRCATGCCTSPPGSPAGNRLPLRIDRHRPWARDLAAAFVRLIALRTPLSWLPTRPHDNPLEHPARRTPANGARPRRGRPQLKIDPALVDHSSALTDNRSWRRFRRGSERRAPEKGPLGSCAAPRRLPCLTGSPRPSRIASARPRPHGVGADVSRMSPTSSRTGNAHADKPCSGTPATGR